MQTIGGYLRVSTDEQATSGLGLEAQQAALERHAERSGARLRLFVDAGASGGSRNGRPGLAALLEAARSGAVDSVAVVRLDRLARSTADALAIAGELEQADVPLVDLSAPVADGTAFGRFSFVLRASVAQLERDLISERTRSALAALRARGVRLGGSQPQGIADPDRLALVASIRRLRADGASFRAIADTLNGQGIRTARGRTWHASTVRALCRNKALTRALGAVA